MRKKFDAVQSQRKTREKLAKEYSLVTKCQENVLKGDVCARAESKAELLERIFGDDYRNDPMMFASAHTNDPVADL